MTSSWLNAKRSWIAGIGLPLVALGLQLLAWTWVQPFVWFFFYPAVFFAAWIGGLEAALLSMTLSIAAVWYFFMPERFSLDIGTPAAFWSMLVFACMGLLFGLVLQQQRTAEALVLARTRSMLDTFFEQSLVGIALFDRTGDFLYANAQWARMFGYDSLEEIIGVLKNIDLVAPEAREELREVMRRRLSGTEANSAFKIKGLCKDGRPIWVSAFGSVFEIDGETTSLVVAFDITDQVNAENELRAMAERFSLAEHAAAVGVFDWNIEDDCLEWDTELKSLYGMDPLGPSPTFDEWVSFLDERDRSSAVNAVQTAIEDGVPYDIRFRIRYDGGRTRFLKGSGIVYRNENNEPVRMVGVNYDITQEVQAESALVASEVRFRAFMDSAPLVAWMQDEDGFILWVNKLFRDMWGDRDYSRVKIADLQPADVAAHLREQDIQVMTTGKPIVMRNEANGPNGEPLHWQTARFAFKDAGGRTVVGAASINVTPEVEAQRQAVRLLETLEQRVDLRTAELKNSNRELESFSYAVSHDLRAPLRSMSGFASILREDYSESLDEQGHQAIDFISSAADEMGQLIDGLLQMSRTSRSEMNRSRIDVSDMAVNIWERLRAETPEREVAFMVEPEIFAYADPLMTEVLLRNLLSNAWKYTSKTEEAAVSVSKTYLDGEPAVTVCDNGTGFDAEKASTIFEPFQRLHRQDEFPGAGIGLATCERIVRRHHGKITATAHQGEGACFTFTLGSSSDSEAKGS